MKKTLFLTLCVVFVITLVYVIINGFSWYFILINGTFALAYVKTPPEKDPELHIQLIKQYEPSMKTMYFKLFWSGTSSFLVKSFGYNDGIDHEISCEEAAGIENIRLESSPRDQALPQFKGIHIPKEIIDKAEFLFAVRKDGGEGNKVYLPVWVLLEARQLLVEQNWSGLKNREESPKKAMPMSIRY